MLNIYEQVDRNKQKSALIIILFVGFVIGTAWIMAKAFGFGSSFVGWALIISGIMSFVSYYWSDKIILTLSNARPASRKQDFHFYTVTENLCLAAQIPLPRLYVINDTAMNAFATGRDPEHAVVVATTGLLDQLSRTELEGVVAHELSHVRNYDIRLMSLVTVLVGLITLLADWFLRMSFWGGRDRDRDDNRELGTIFVAAGFILALLSPLIANLIQLAISRRREFLADSSSAVLTKYPEGLARALEKIAADHEPLEVANKATAHLYIANPFHLDSPQKSRRQTGTVWFANLFNTHPSIDERIKALREME